MSNHRHIDQGWEVSIERPTEVVAWAKKFIASEYATDEDGERRPLLECLRRMIAEKPGEWWIGHHFGFGMWFRNQMWDAGFNDEKMGCNLDDIYIKVIEEACAS